MGQMTKLERAVVRWFPEVNGMWAKRDLVVTMRPPDLLEIRVKGTRGRRGGKPLSLSRLWKLAVGLLESGTAADLGPQKAADVGKPPKKAKPIAPAKKRRRPTIVGAGHRKGRVSAGSKKRPPKKGGKRTAVKRTPKKAVRIQKRKTGNRSRSRKRGRR